MGGALAGLAAEVGRGIVEAGCALLCGGLGGVMEAAARGGQRARAAGADGVVVGILPGDAADAANAFCDVVVATGMGKARNAIIACSADAVILIDGGAGTLSEAALAWQLGKPVVALAASGGWATRLAGEAIDASRADRVMRADGASEAVALAVAGRPTD